MKQYIDKDVLVTELKYRIKECDKLANLAADNNLPNTLQANKLLISQYTNLIHFINTLEVKEANSTNAFIKKACEWLENHNDYLRVLDNGRGVRFDMTQCVSDFRKAMKGE